MHSLENLPTSRNMFRNKFNQCVEIYLNQLSRTFQNFWRYFRDGVNFISEWARGHKLTSKYGMKSMQTSLFGL